MSRPTQIRIDKDALLHNLSQIKAIAPGKSVIAMVKANAYGCGLKQVIPTLDGRVDAFGVACLEEALAIRALGSATPCILFQGVFSAQEWVVASEYHFSCIIHQPHQLEWLLENPLPKPVKIWIKVNTGMHRLGFKSDEVQKVKEALQACSWVDKDIGILTHLACADEPNRPENEQQIATFENIRQLGWAQCSLANSATLMSFPEAHADAVRPGIMLYGVSPFAEKTGMELELLPVMHFVSAISAIMHNPPGAAVGYAGTWSRSESSIIGVVPVGYGDGYPRHIKENTPVWVKGREVYIAGRVSMDMITLDLTDHPDIQIGEPVELWGVHIPVERIAHSAGTIAYELLCQVTERPRK